MVHRLEKSRPTVSCDRVGRLDDDGTIVAADLGHESGLGPVNGEVLSDLVRDD